MDTSCGVTVGINPVLCLFHAITLPRVSGYGLGTIVPKNGKLEGKYCLLKNAKCISSSWSLLATEVLKHFHFLVRVGTESWKTQT